MKVYEALYCPSTCESAYTTISLHFSKEGAEKAILEHQQQIFKDHEMMCRIKLDSGETQEEVDEYMSEFPWDFDRGWDITETEILP